MLRCKLTFHSPESIYSFLEKMVGSLNMAVRYGQAFISFYDPAHASLAYKKYGKKNFSHFPFRLHLYNGKDIKDAQFIEEEHPLLSIAETEPTTPKQQTIRMAEEATKINQRNNVIENLVKHFRKNLIEHVANYDVLLNISERKRSQLVRKAPNLEEKYKIQTDLEHKLATKLNELSVGIRNEIRGLTYAMRQYGTEPHDLEIGPIITHSPSASGPVFAKLLTPEIEYINKDACFQARKIIQLNNLQFACSMINSNRSRPKGKIKIYNLNKEIEESCINVREGCYGLHAMKNRLLVGNKYGSISFMPFSNIKDKQQTVLLHTEKSKIVEIVSNGMLRNKESIFTLASDFTLKMWTVSQDEVVTDVSTLFFNQQFSCGNEDIRIATITVIEPGRTFVFGNGCYLQFEDIQNKYHSRHFRFGDRPVSRLCKVNENIIAAADSDQIAFFDLREFQKANAVVRYRQAKTMKNLDDFSIMIGGGNGDLGVIQLRRPDAFAWTNKTCHKSRIIDICKMEGLMITADIGGQLTGWTPK